MFSCQDCSFAFVVAIAVWNEQDGPFIAGGSEDALCCNLTALIH